MNPHLELFVGLRVNGIAQDWGRMELRHVPVKLVRFILDSEMDGKQFSSMELRLSKRQINWDSKPQDAEEQLLNLADVTEVNLEDPIDARGDITYNELFALSDDPVWTQYQALQRNPENFETNEGFEIRQLWNRKYGESKFVRLIQRSK